MIRIKILGGLGNQMFQYAAARSLAEKHGAEVLLDISGFASYRTWPYLLDRLCVPQNLAPEKRGVLSIMRRISARLKLPDTGLYREQHFHFDKDFMELKHPVTLEGYFQSPLYFQDAEDTMRRHFQLRSPLSTESRAVADAIQSVSCPVSLHVRRGDYLSSAAAQTVHGMTTIEYYQRAVRSLRSISGQDIHLFMFSDDPDFIEAQMNFDIPRTIVRGAKDRPYEDMHLMAMCRHNIIANSTFSWWGAWLNSDPDKIVIAPRRWFTPEALRQNNTTDLFPERWILL